MLGVGIVVMDFILFLLNGGNKESPVLAEDWAVKAKIGFSFVFVGLFGR
jgi:hypothetical protein